LRRTTTAAATAAVGIARGCSGCTCNPQGGEKIFSGLIYRKNVKVHPQPEQESIFRTVFACGLDLEVYLDGL